MSRHDPRITPIGMERIELDDGTTLSETVRRVKHQLTQGLQSLLPSPLMLTPAMVASELKAAQMLLAPWCSFSWPAVKERALHGPMPSPPHVGHWLTLYTQGMPATLSQREDAALENLTRLAVAALGPQQANLQQLLQKYPTLESITELARVRSHGADWFPSLAGADALTESQRKQLADAMPRAGVPAAEEDDTLYRSSLHKLVRHFTSNHFLHIKQMYLGRCWARCYPTTSLAVEKPRPEAWVELLQSFVTAEDPPPTTSASVADVQLIEIEKTALLNMLVSRWIREDVCAALEDRLSSLVQLEHTALFRPMRAAHITIPDTALRLWEPLQTECQRLLRQHTCEDSLASLRALTQSLYDHVWYSSLAGRERARTAIHTVCRDAALRCWDLHQALTERLIQPHNQTVLECKRAAIRTYRTAQSLVTDGIRLLVAGVKDLLQWSPLLRLQPLTPAQLAFRTQWHRPTTLRTCGCNAHLASYATCFLQEGTLSLVRRLPEVYVQLVTHHRQVP